MAKNKQVARIPFEYDSDAASLASAFEVKGDSMTHQSFKEECDINTIISRFGIGDMGASLEVPLYTEADFSDVTDYQSALNQVLAAQASFGQLPAAVRAEFGNDPGWFVAACSDPGSRDQLLRLGLLREDLKPAAVAPAEDSTVNT